MLLFKPHTWLTIVVLGATWGCTSLPNGTFSNPPQPPETSSTPSTTSDSSNTTFQPESPNPSVDSKTTFDPGIPLYFADSQGIAIQGTDPVAYFRQGEPTPGRSEFEVRWGGVIWQFSSAENKDLFEKNPEAYAPQYGGYCAWAVAQGYTAPIDPNAWKIVDDRLYLNFNTRIQQRWERNIPGFIEQANENWPGVLTEPQSSDRFRDYQPLTALSKT